MIGTWTVCTLCLKHTDRTWWTKLVVSQVTTKSTGISSCGSNLTHQLIAIFVVVCEIGIASEYSGVTFSYHKNRRVYHTRTIVKFMDLIYQLIAIFVYLYIELVSANKAVLLARILNKVPPHSYNSILQQQRGELHLVTQRTTVKYCLI